MDSLLLTKAQSAAETDQDYFDLGNIQTIFGVY
jgi:hypothetical protein